MDEIPARDRNAYDSVSSRLCRRRYPGVHNCPDTNSYPAWLGKLKNLLVHRSSHSSRASAWIGLSDSTKSWKGVKMTDTILIVVPSLLVVVALSFIVLVRQGHISGFVELVRAVFFALIIATVVGLFLLVLIEAFYSITNPLP